MIRFGARARVPDGTRIYVVAPLGGRLAALDDALARIAADANGEESVRIVLLGGLVDGPDAPALVLRAMKLAEQDGVAVLRGPAEDALLAGTITGGWPSADRVPAAVRHWLTRRPADGRIGDYHLAHGCLTARGRNVPGALIALDGLRRRVLA